MRSTTIGALLFSLLWPLGAMAASNGFVSQSLVSVDAACRNPQYAYTFRAVARNDDDGFGRDFVTLVVYDDALRVLSVETLALTVTNAMDVQTIDYDPTPEFTTRPLHARLFDSTQAFAGTGAMLRHAIDAPLLYEIEHDPADDAIACEDVNRGPEIQLYGATGSGPITSSGIAPEVVETLSLQIPEPADLAIAYTAECSVDGSSTTFVGISFEVDGSLASPTNPGYALCAGNGSGVHDQFVSGRVLGSIRLPAGDHLLEVLADLSGFGQSNEWRLDNRSLVVKVPEPAGPGVWIAGIALLAALGRRPRWTAPPSRLLGWALCVLFVGTVVAETANAQAKIRSESYDVPQVWNSGDAQPVVVSPLGGNGVNIITTGHERIQLTLSAECQVSSSDAGTWLGIQIYLSGQLLEPTGTSFAFCTSDGTPGGGWQTVSTTFTFDIPPPTIVNSLSIEARLFPYDPGETARLDDVHLTVIQLPNP